MHAMSSRLGLIVGLGNPGPQYARTRHNAGFAFVDVLADRHGVGFDIQRRLFAAAAQVETAGHSLRLLKPATFMNSSGKSVLAALRFWKIVPEQMLVVHDDLDLPAGAARLKFDGGHGGQNGLRDIIRLLGHARFHRLRIGIGHPGHRDAVTPWVLGRPSAQDETAIGGAIDAAIDILPLAVRGDFMDAMTRLHTARRASPSSPHPL